MHAKDNNTMSSIDVHSELLWCQYGVGVTYSQKLRYQFLPGVVDAIVVQRISNSDFSSIQSTGKSILPVGDYHREDFIFLEQIHSPPRVEMSFCVSTGTMAIHAVTIPINGIVCESISVKV